MKKYFFYLITPAMLLVTCCSSENGGWKKAKAQNNIQAYEQFIKEYPQSVYKDSANFEIKEIIHPTGVVISLPSLIMSAEDVVNGKINNLNFDGNTIKVKLRDGKIIEALATQEQMEEVVQGEKNVKLKKTDDNQWKVVDDNKTTKDTIK
jgi:hypothetical protein